MLTNQTIVLNSKLDKYIENKSSPTAAHIVSGRFDRRVPITERSAAAGHAEVIAY